MRHNLGYRDDTVFILVRTRCTPGRALNICQLWHADFKYLNLSDLHKPSTEPTRCSGWAVATKFILAGTMAARVFIVSPLAALLKPNDVRLRHAIVPSNRTSAVSGSRLATSEGAGAVCLLYETRDARAVVDTPASLASWRGCVAPIRELRSCAAEKPESRHSCSRSPTRWKLW
jgi:hypothetical protein